MVCWILVWLMVKLLFKGDLVELNRYLSFKILTTIGSDHFPISLTIQEESCRSNCPFKFERMWFQDQNFLGLVEEWWREGQILGSKMYYYQIEETKVENTTME